MGAMVSEIFDAKRWRQVEGFSFTDITYHRAVESGTVRVAFNRPEVRNASRPHTVDELYVASSVTRPEPRRALAPSAPPWRGRRG
jgi:naphthoate synthase